MTAPDDFSDLYGLSIDSSPKYTDEQQRSAFRDVFWADQEIHPDLKQLLEDAGTSAMRRIVERQLRSLTDFGLRVEATLMSNTDERGYYEWFITEINVLFQSEDYDDVADVVNAPSTGSAIVNAIRSAFQRYIETCGLSIRALVLKHEISEYGGS